MFSSPPPPPDIKGNIRKLLVIQLIFSGLLRLTDSITAETTNVHISRSAILNDMLQFYHDDADLASHTLHVEFLGEPGDDFGGLTRELFTVFWAEATKDFFVGEDCVVPALPTHRVRKESWKMVALGKILSHSTDRKYTLQLCQSLSC